MTPKFFYHGVLQRSVKNNHEMRKYSSNVHKIGGEHLQCVKNHFTKFEYKGLKLLKLQITQGRHPKSVADRQMD